MVTDGRYDHILTTAIHCKMSSKRAYRSVHDLPNSPSVPRSSPVVFSPHWWQRCLGQVCGKPLLLAQLVEKLKDLTESLEVQSGESEAAWRS